MTGRRSIAVAFVALITLGAAGCDGSSGTAGSNGSQTPDAAAPPDSVAAAVIVAAEPVCRLVGDSANARALNVTGADGVQSVVAGGRGYWFFGDTVRLGPNGRRDVIAASLATSTDTDASDCIDLEFKSAGGTAVPMFPPGDETTAWPDGVLALDDGSIVFYMVKVMRESPFAWHVESVGLGRIPAGTTDGVRVVEQIWGDDTTFGSNVSGVRSPVRVGDDVVVYIGTDDQRTYAARVPLDRIGDLEAYAYWDGGEWNADADAAEPLWPAGEASTLPPDNGVQVSYDEQLGTWVALYNGHLATLQARTADEPQGPWSEPVTWLDCRSLVEDVYPYCYSAELHRHLTGDDGTLYATFSSQQPYDVQLVALHPGTAIHEWRDASGGLRYAAESPGDGYEQSGVAFYASLTPATGLVPVYELASDSGVSYELAAPGPGGAAAFYAYASASLGAVRTKPVYRYELDGAAALATGERDGWERGEIAFHVPCLRALQIPSDCA